MGRKNVCHVCGSSYTSYPLLVNHYMKQHKELLPDGKSVHQELFDNRKGNVGRKHICVICRKNPVPWNDESRRYERFCSTRCRDQARALAVKNMKAKYGKDTLLRDPAHQQMMQYSRDISGEYKFKDGSTIRYMGSYEKDFLVFYENDLKFPPKDIIECPYYFQYIYKGEKHAYIPDYYITSLDLIVEIKEGTNNHPHMQVDRAKEALKDKVVASSGHHYFKVIEKNYVPLVNYIELLKGEE